MSSSDRQTARLPPLWMRLAGSWSPFLLFLVSPLVVYPLRFVKSGLLDGGDDALSNLPFLVHSAQKLLRFEFSWTPALWLGTSVVDEPEFATFYLPRMIILLFSPITGFAVYVLSHYVLAQSSLFLYARSLGASRAAAVFGALAYGFSGFMLGHRGHTMYIVAGAWAPLCLYFIRRAEERRDRLSYAGAAVSFAALPLAGAAQLTLYLGVLVLVLHAALALFSRSPRPFVAAVLGLFPGALIGLAQVLPSMAFVREVVQAPRESYALSVDMSYDPRLFSLLVAPHDPTIRVEHYSRIGAVILVFACAAFFRRREPVVRSFAIIAVGSFVLMMGRFVPFLSPLLHSIPVISVFRGPVRHNFELGLATSLLATFGFDAIVSSTPSRKQRLGWLVLGASSAAALFFLGRAGLRSGSLDVHGQALATGIKDYWLGVGAVLLCVACSMVALFHARTRLLLGAIALVAPIAEARLSTRSLDRDWPNYSAALERARERLGHPGTRLLPPNSDVAGLDTLPDDSAALLPGLQSLTGYASMANQDSAALLDLDMMGRPRFPADLAWSRLPSVFGVTHLILPEAICDPFYARVGPDPAEHACIETAEDAPELALEGRVHCTVPLSAGVSRFGVGLDFPATMRSRKTKSPALQVRFIGKGRDRGREPSMMFGGSTKRHRTKIFHSRWLPPNGLVSFFPLEPGPLVLDDFTIAEERLAPAAELGADRNGMSDRNEPPSARPRAANEGNDAEPTADHDAEVGASAWRPRRLLRATRAFDLQGKGIVRNHGIRLEHDGMAFFEYHLPTRPITVTADVESTRPQVPLSFGLAYDRPTDAPVTERFVPPAVLSGRQRFSYTMNAPAEAPRIELRGQSDPKRAARILRLEARSACTERKYVPAGSVGNGWTLYENRDALPRVFTVGAVRRTRNIDEARQILREDGSFDPRAAALVQGAASFPGLRGGTVEASRLEDERVELRVSALEGPTFVVLNDRFHPRWRATIDGRRTRIYRTNGLVRGVLVPQGRHTIEMRFAVAWTVRAGAVFALLGLLFILVAPYIEPVAKAYRRKPSR